MPLHLQATWLNVISWQLLTLIIASSRIRADCAVPPIMKICAGRLQPDLFGHTFNRVFRLQMLGRPHARTPGALQPLGLGHSFGSRPSAAKGAPGIEFHFAHSDDRPSRLGRYRPVSWMVVGELAADQLPTCVVYTHRPAAIAQLHELGMADVAHHTAGKDDFDAALLRMSGSA